MPKRKKPTNGAAPRVNKSEWIRGQPIAMAAKDVVAKAKSAGIELSLAQVYTARSSAKRTPGGIRGAAGKRASAGRAASNNSTDEVSFRRFVLTLGLDRVESMLADLKRSAGL
jgi:hypothetical protein